jgi:DNA primase
MSPVTEYYRQITAVDIAPIARELLAGRIMQESLRLVQADCPHHASQSHRSLQIMLDKQGWYCFGCGVGGDVLQLVEFVQSGQVTRGQSGAMPESHRAARDFLAARVGLPPLAQYGLTAEQICEENRNAAAAATAGTGLIERLRRLGGEAVQEEPVRKAQS